MLNKLTTSLFFFYILNTIVGNAQDYIIEQGIIDCIDENKNADSISFKEKIIAHEQLLISEKLLKDNTGGSYIMALNRFVIDRDFNYSPSKDFSFPDLSNCKARFTNTNATKIKRTVEIKDSIIKSGTYTPYNFAKNYLKLLNEEDLEQDYYKLQVFQLFQIIDVSPKKDALFDELNGKLINKDSVNLINALIVSIGDKNQLSINNEEVSLDSLKDEIREYLKEYGSWSIFVLESTPNATYGQYKKMTTTLLDEVFLLRKQQAIEKYSEKYQCLNKEQKATIEEQYPLIIAE